MGKKVKTVIKLQIPAAKATPAPPVGPALGQHGLNIVDFVNRFNEQTKEKGDSVIPVEITVYEDRTFNFVCKQPPVADLIKKALGKDKGAADVIKEKVGKLTKEQVSQIARQKMVDLNAFEQVAAEQMVIGTARSMGVEVES